MYYSRVAVGKLIAREETRDYANVPRELVKCISNVLVKNWFRVVSVINGDF